MERAADRMANKQARIYLLYYKDHIPTLDQTDAPWTKAAPTYLPSHKSTSRYCTEKLFDATANSSDNEKEEEEVDWEAGEVEKDKPEQEEKDTPEEPGTSGSNEVTDDHPIVENVYMCGIKMPLHRSVQ